MLRSKGNPEGISVKGLERLEKSFSNMDSSVRPELKQATEEAVHQIHERVPDYPFRTSRYKRTGNLGRSINTKVESLSKGYIGKIGSDASIAPYNVYVISEVRIGGRGPQARIHEGIWYTLHQVVRDARSTVIRTYRRAVKRILRKG